LLLPSVNLLLKRGISDFKKLSSMIKFPCSLRRRDILPPTPRDFSRITDDMPAWCHFEAAVKPDIPAPMMIEGRIVSLELDGLLAMGVCFIPDHKLVERVD
jgi:hypothetical protein